MQAFHNDPGVKQEYIDRVIAHREADNLVKGVGWENGKGCAIGCTLESYDHSLYPDELGVPESIAILEDVIFEGLPNDLAQQWPERFLSAIEPGADLSLVPWKFLHWLITQDQFGQFHHESVRECVKQCADVIESMTRGEPVDKGVAEAAESARFAARTAAEAAESARFAARTAAESAESARFAARASESARFAARAAAWSAQAAAWSAQAADGSNIYAAQFAAFEKMSEKLLALLEAA